jgi:hypothetical protein
MQSAIRGDVLHCRVFPQQICRRDFLDGGILENAAKRKPEAFDIVGRSGNKEVEVLRRSGESQNVERDGTTDKVLYPFPFQRREYFADKFQVPRCGSPV